MARFWCVIKDHNGRTIRVICGSLRVCDSIKVENLGLLFGLCELKALGIMGCCVEGDCNMAIGWGLGKSIGPWLLA